MLSKDVSRLKDNVDLEGSMGAFYAVLWLDFKWYPYPWSPVEITPVLTTFLDITPVCTTFMFHDSLWHHNGSWHCQRCPNMVQQWVMMLLWTSIVTPQWIKTLLCVHNMVSQWIVTLLGTSFAMYYYTKLWYCCFTRKLFKSVYINH